MGNELAALGVADGGSDRDLDAELVGPMGLALADAFDCKIARNRDPACEAN
jgi:hypothetical protein